MLGIGLGLVASGIGCIAAMVGLGGGFLVVPLLILVWGLEFEVAAGTSLLMIIFTSTSATLAYWRQKRVDVSLGIVIAATTIPGAILGAFVTDRVDPTLLKILLGAFLLAVSVRMMVPSRLGGGDAGTPGGTRRMVDADGKVFEYSPKPLRAAPGGFLAGLASGTFGIGGGALVVPLLRFGVGVPMHIAAPTSMFAMVFTSATGAIVHAGLGNASFSHAIPLGIGMIVGTQIGARIAKRTKAKVLEKLLGICILVVGARMIMAGL
jgi:uncharacterized membrane protein YfcA